MDAIEIKTIDILTVDSVSILTKKYAEIDGKLVQIGMNHRCGYDNSTIGRQLLLDSEPESITKDVMVVWGDSPTVEGVNAERVPEHTAEERIATMEATIKAQQEEIAMLNDTLLEVLMG